MIDQIGAVWPLGVPVAHSWREIGALLWVIQEERIGLVVEIGVDQGGLGGLLVARGGMTGMAYLGIEKDPAKVEPLGDGEHFRTMVADAFEPATVWEVASEIFVHKGPCLIYCDGGDKRREFLTYLPLLRPGDIIGIHDVGREVTRTEFLGLDGLTEVGQQWASTAQIFLRRTHT